MLSELHRQVATLRPRVYSERPLPPEAANPEDDIAATLRAALARASPVDKRDNDREAHGEGGDERPAM